MGETIIDQRGRVLIPKEIREELNLRPDQKISIELRGGEIILKPAASVDEFKSELRGCVSGSTIDPLKLKEIWGIEHAHR
ncbi:MAG: AbrB/MazE/SpoVT family DNA-binding domain-containing protein [Candidatus Geothermarchaeales archaeon]